MIECFLWGVLVGVVLAYAVVQVVIAAALEDSDEG